MKLLIGYNLLFALVGVIIPLVSAVCHQQVKINDAIMTIEESFIKDTYDKVYQTILNIDSKLTPDIYAISFWKYNLDDDPRRQTIAVGYNTLSNFKDNIAKASSQDEAKWNFAFWLQNEETLVGGDDPNYQAWVKQLRFYYTDNDKNEDFERTIELGDRIELEFMEIIIELSKKLHENGIVETKFGKAIPIIIHELEYYYKPKGWTIEGNPIGVSDEFENWVESLG